MSKFSAILTVGGLGVIIALGYYVNQQLAPISPEQAQAQLNNNIMWVFLPLGIMGLVALIIEILLALPNWFLSRCTVCKRKIWITGIEMVDKEHPHTETGYYHQYTTYPILFFHRGCFGYRHRKEITV